MEEDETLSGKAGGPAQSEKLWGPRQLHTRNRRELLVLNDDRPSLSKPWFFLGGDKRAFQGKNHLVSDVRSLAHCQPQTYGAMRSLQMRSTTPE